MSLFGGRRRKLLLCGAAAGGILAVLVGFLLVPDSKKDDSVQIRLQQVTTNEANDAIAWFFVTNAGEKTVFIVTHYSGIEAEESWLEFPDSGKVLLELRPGQSEKFPMSIPRDGRVWRGKVLWLHKPTDFQQARWQLREKAASILPALKQDAQATWNSHVRTNYSAEFTRSNMANFSLP